MRKDVTLDSITKLVLRHGDGSSLDDETKTKLDPNYVIIDFYSYDKIVEQALIKPGDPVTGLEFSEAITIDIGEAK